MLIDNERQLVPLPAGLSVIAATPLTGAGLSAYHAVSGAAGRLTAGSTAVVLGAGALGHLTIQALRAITQAHIVAVDVHASDLELAARSGANECVLASPDWNTTQRNTSGSRRVQAVFDTVGSTQTLAYAASAIASDGWLAIVGLGGGTLPVSVAALPLGVTVRPTLLGSRHELVGLLAVAARGAITAEVTEYDVADASIAYDEIERGTVVGCAVVSVDPQYVFPD